METASSTDAVSAEALWRLGTAYFGRKVVITAAELGVFTVLADSPADEESIRKALGLHGRGLRDFLDALVSLGMLDRDGTLYRNTAVSDHYLNQSRSSYAGAFLASADKRWDQLAEALRTGEPQNRWGSGPKMFTEQYRTTDAWRNFNAGMDYLNGMIGPRLAEAYDWSSTVSVADVGGGRGNLVVPILRRNPALRAVVFDLPAVRPVFEEHAGMLGLADRMTFVGGDFFNDRLPAADVLVFSHVLHDWGQEERRTLLRNAFESLPPGGRVLICDPMIDDDRSGTPNALLTSLNMLMVTPHGSEYTRSECRSLLKEAGFDGLRQVPLGSNNTLVIGLKPR
ncbi:acetylserotonin O-methyltransferase [Streptosporangium sp. KLBMP 9127]|nr:acetylserotonin O-methyltransferase [Streptosporangium sp. KLBMP 9127]